VIITLHKLADLVSASLFLFIFLFGNVSDYQKVKKYFSKKWEKVG